MLLFPRIPILLLGFVPLALASAGDRSDDFQHCLFRCQLSQCDRTSQDVLPIALRLTRWTCIDNCKYTCMHDITNSYERNGEQMQQYYGKWPFWRLAGMQEPASVVFSLMNLWVHAKGFLQVKSRISEGHPLKRYLLVWSATSVNTWIWSAVFHTRDTPTTEKLDYFSAALTILTALYFSAIRIFHMYTPSQFTLRTSNSGKSSASLRVWTVLCMLVYTLHVGYLTLLPRFDYTYNVIFNLVVGLSHNALWLTYSLPSSFRRFRNRPKTYKPSFVNSAIWLVVFTTAATALELFDFPPLGRVIDAHSLWHLSTVPIAVYWYRFLIQDALDDSWREQRT